MLIANCTPGYSVMTIFVIEKKTPMIANVKMPVLELIFRCLLCTAYCLICSVCCLLLSTMTLTLRMPTRVSAKSL